MTTLIPTKTIYPIFKGNTFLGLQFKYNKEVDGAIVPGDLTGASILIQFRLNYKSGVAFEFSTADNTIVISDLSNFTLMPRDMNYDAHKYVSDIKLTLPNQEVQQICLLNWEIKDIYSK